MVKCEPTCKKQENKAKKCKEHPNGLYVIGHLCVARKVLVSCEDWGSAVVDIWNKHECLDWDKAKESPMIQLTHTPTDPKAMMVKFPNASIAVSAVFSPKRNLVEATNLTATILGNADFLDISKRWLSFYLLINGILLIDITHLNIAIFATLLPAILFHILYFLLLPLSAIGTFLRKYIGFFTVRMGVIQSDTLIPLSIKISHYYIFSFIKR